MKIQNRSGLKVLAAVAYIYIDNCKKNEVEAEKQIDGSLRVKSGEPDPVTVTDVTAVTGLSQNTVRRKVKGFQEEGLVSLTGGGNSKFRIVPEMREGVLWRYLSGDF